MKTNKETPPSADMPLRTAAIVAGLGLLAMAVLAGVANFSVFQKLVIQGDAKATAENIIASAGAFRMGIFFFLLVGILDVVVAWALYVLFKPTHKSLSLLAAWFRIVYAAIFASALMNLFSALQYFTGADTLKALDVNQAYALGMVALGAFRSGWDMGLVIFGLHLLVLGYLVFKSGYAVRWWGIILSLLLVIAGAGYMADSIGKFLVAGYNASIGQFTFVGEVLLIFWLLWKGIKGFDNKQAMKS